MKQTKFYIIGLLALLFMSCQQNDIIDTDNALKEVPVSVSFVMNDPQSRSLVLPGDKVEDLPSKISVVLALGSDDNSPIYLYELVKNGNKYDGKFPGEYLQDSSCKLYFIANADLIEGYTSFKKLGDLRSAKLPEVPKSGLNRYVIASKVGVKPNIINGVVYVANVKLSPTVARIQLKYDNPVTPIKIFTISSTLKRPGFSGFFGSTSVSSAEEIDIVDTDLNFKHDVNAAGLGYYFVYPSSKQSSISINVDGKSTIIPIGVLVRGSTYSFGINYGKLLLGFDLTNSGATYSSNTGTFLFPTHESSISVSFNSGTTFQYSESWFRIENIATRATGVTTMKLVCDYNHTFNNRTGFLTFAKDGKTETYIINQQSEPINRNDLANWMKYVRGSKYISQLSIPGTHNSGTSTFTGNFPAVVKCQSKDLTSQLEEFGVRAFDIRLSRRDNQLIVFHGSESMKRTFTQVVQECERFLTAHPTETILMSIKDEGNTLNTTRTFVQIIYDDHVMRNRTLFYTQSDVPTLDQVRGKIVIINRFANNNFLGLYVGWRDNATFTSLQFNVKAVVQDEYQITSHSQIPTKWSKAKSAFDNAVNNAAAEPKTLNINFLSASGQRNYFPFTPFVPYDIASGVDGYTGMNSYMASYLRALDRSKNPCVGIVMMDYVEVPQPYLEYPKSLVSLNFN